MFNCHCRIEWGQWPATDPTASCAATFSGDRSWSPDRSWSSDWSWSWSSYRLEATFTWSQSRLGLNTLLTPFFKCQDTSIKKKTGYNVCFCPLLYISSLQSWVTSLIWPNKILIFFFFFVFYNSCKGSVVTWSWSLYGLTSVFTWFQCGLSWSSRGLDSVLVSLKEVLGTSLTSRDRYDPTRGRLPWYCLHQACFFMQQCSTQFFSWKLGSCFFLWCFVRDQKVTLVCWSQVHTLCLHLFISQQ